MKRIVLTIAVCSGLAMAAGSASAVGQQTQPAEPTQSEVNQTALQKGPATPQYNYLAHMDKVTPHQDKGPADQKPVPPLTKTEMGMLYNACIAYIECKTQYAAAKAHEEALQKAKKQKAADPAGH
ncbi:MAG TPA: hypothetical protein VJQ86_10275 [Rhodanobacteraceae bacterium]|nr:hypothetical protein [Rhodanobacteraceae bacterium]